MKPLHRHLALAFLLAAALPAARAGDRSPLVFGGASGSADSQYAYLGVIVPAAGSRLGQGLFYRAVGSWLGYRYDATLGGATTRVRARAPGLDLGVGYAWGDERWHAELSLAAGVRHTQLRPDDLGSGARGTHGSLTPQLQARGELARGLDADLIASQAFGPRDRFVRARLGWTPAGGWRIGPQAGWQAGRDYRQASLGVFAAAPLGQGLGLEVSLGRAEDRDGRRSTVAGLGFSRAW